jgi:tRNA(Glu) U13 pseudouridine synthase TruD
MANFFKRQRELKRGSSSGNSITVNLSGVAGTPEAIAHAVTQAIERGTVPRLRTAIREANQ